MTATVQEIIRMCAELAQDPELIKINTADWIDWINDGQRNICNARPDACVTTEAIPLTANTSKQTLPASRRRLLDLTRNMGAGGSTPGKAIRGPVPRETLDGFDPDWNITTGSYVKEFIYNPDDPKVFWIFPHLTTAWYVEALLAKNPTEVEDHEDTLDIDDAYTPAIINWCCFRVYSMDSEESPNYQRALGFEQTFNTMLGIKTGADRNINPARVANDKNSP